MAGARGCFNCGGCAWCFCVVAVVVSSSRALCTDACTYTSPLFFPPFLVVVYDAVLTGTATSFFFFLQIAIHRPGTIKIVIGNPCRVHRNPSCSCQKNQLDTRLQTAPRRVHPLGKKNIL